MSKSHAATKSNHYAILTDRGPAAIAVVNVCGPAVQAFLLDGLRLPKSIDPAKARPGQVLRARLLDNGETLDDILVSIHQTGPDWDIRLHLHGGRGIVQRCGELLAKLGFVESADQCQSLWNAKNRIEAEAFALLPRMTTLAGARWLSEQTRVLPQALQRLHDEIDIVSARAKCRALLGAPPFFEWYRAPLRVALVGPPNAGKSSLANALSDRPASIVSAVAGTTRDWLEIPGEIQGYPVLWLDTAGLRRSADALEAASIERTHEVMAGADAILFVLDGSPEARAARQEFAHCYSDDRPTCVALNKADCMAPDTVIDAAEHWQVPITRISATERTGLGRLIKSLLKAVGRDMAAAGSVSPFTKRQTLLLREAAESDRERFRRLISECIGTI